MKKRIFLGTTIVGIIAFLFCVIMLCRCFSFIKISEKEKEIQQVKNKIQQIEKDMKKNEKEKSELEKDNQDKVKVLEVWEEELKREEEENQS